MFDINFGDLVNFFDITVLIILFISCFFAFKNGLIKSIFNLGKWIAIIVLIKLSFNILRPYVDEYIQNSTIADICIFLSILICSYILLSTFNRVIIGIIQPSKSGFADYMFGSIFGLLRGYIIVVLIFSSINASFPYSSWPKFTQNGSLIEIIIYGEEFLNTIPQRIEDAGKYIA